ncbi:MAG: hypothetical protein C4576_17905 [Desulfobacteraceae bacterium]|nr:MAG: hypothetical protein C4576_17905 [Desulfobacteraceae bacterium]
MKSERTLISVDELDSEPGPYTMSFGFDLNPMTESIGRVGVLNPPFIARENGKVRIVAGYRRIAALKALGVKETECLDLSGSGLSASDRLLLNLFDNLSTRVLNGVEKGMALERLSDHFAEQDVLEHYMPLLGLPAHAPVLATYLRIGELDARMRASFAAGNLSMQSVRSLAEMDSEARDAFSWWFDKLQFNFNQQIQFIDLVNDIASISGESPDCVLSSPGLRAILEDRAANGPQKVKSVIDALRAMRLPRVAEAEKSFRRRVRDLRLPKGTTIHHSPFFESPEYRLEIRFRDGRALRSRINELSSIEDLERIQDPWKE